MSRHEKAEEFQKELSELNSPPSDTLSSEIGGAALHAVSQDESEFLREGKENYIPANPELERVMADIRTRAYEAKSNRRQKLAAGELEVTSQLYENIMTDHRILSPQEEVALAMSIEKGDLSAKDKLVTHNMKLVRRIASKFFNEKTTMDDVVQMGTLGLIRASEKFDYRKGYKFSTYASLWIKQSIQRESVNTLDMVRLPANKELQLRKIMSFQLKYQQENEGEYPSFEQVSKAVDIKAREIDFLLAFRDFVTSLDELVGSAETSRMEFVQSHEPDPAQQVISKEREEKISLALKKLPHTVAEAIKLHYGFDGEESLGITAIARKLGIKYYEAETIVTTGENLLRQELKELVQH